MLELIFIALLIAACAFLSLAEISLAGSRKTKLRLLADGGNARAQRVLALQDQPGNFFTVVQICLNAVAILGGIVGEQALSPYTRALLAWVYDGPWLDSAAFALSFLLVTSAFVMFADLVPKRLAMVRPEPVAMWTVGPMLKLVWLLAPLVWVYASLADLIFKLFKLPTRRSEDITSADVLAMVEAGAQSGGVLQQEQKLICNVFELDTRLVSSAMTPRESIVYITLGESEESIRRKIVEQAHSKFPVCEAGIDSVMGYLDWKDVLPRLAQGQELSPRANPALRKVLMLPDSLSLFEALERFRDAKEDFGLIINEYALVVGLLTLQDVMSTVMGDLVRPMQEDYIVQRDADSWLLDGMTPMVEAAQVFGLGPIEGQENFETVAGFLMYRLRRVPRRTDVVLQGGYRFEVLDIDNYRIDQVLVTRAVVDNPGAAPTAPAQAVALQ